MKEQMREFTEELVQHVFHPVRLINLCEKHEIDLIEYVDIVG